MAYHVELKSIGLLMIPSQVVQTVNNHINENTMKP